MKITPNKLAGFTASFAFAFLFLLCSFVPVKAQNENAPAPPPCGDANKPFQQRTLDEILCLTPEQRIQIRQINESLKDQVQAARRRLQFAKRALDEAIYGDNPADDATVEQRAKELGEAQGEIARLQATRELKMRRVLTQEQIRRFRFWLEWKARQERNKLLRQQNEQNKQRPNIIPQRNNFKQGQKRNERPIKQGVKKP